MADILCGAVLFAKDLAHMSRFYEQVAGLRVQHADADHVVLRASGFELVLHGIPKKIAKEINITVPPELRTEVPCKLFFAVPSLAQARTLAAQHGGGLHPAKREWSARGFRACDGFDPEGNVIQLREVAPLPST